MGAAGPQSWSLNLLMLPCVAITMLLACVVRPPPLRSQTLHREERGEWPHAFLLP